MEQRILFRCDGGKVPEIGTGHVRRCLLLAGYHGRRYGSVIRFLMREYPEGVAMVRDSGVPVEVQTFAPASDERRALAEALEQFQPDVCVFDRLNVDGELFALCRMHGVVTVSLDDVGSGLTQADIAINAILEHPGTCYSGPAYSILPDAPPDALPQRNGRRQGLSLFISTGGYDHGRLAVRILRAVQHMPAVQQITLVTSEAEVVQHCRSQVSTDRHASLNVVQDASNLAQIMAQCDLGVVSGGLTMYEAMRVGLPSVVVAQYAHQAATAAAYASRGAVVAVGLPSDGFDTTLRQAVEELIQTPDSRTRLSRNARRLIDGKGLPRVADLIRICDFLEWDTKFFGRRIAGLKPIRLTERIVEYAFDRCRQWGIECLYYQCDCHHAQSVRLAEQHGFHFVDMRLTLEYPLRHSPVPPQDPAGRPTIRACHPDDVPALKGIASDSHLDSRYYFDEHFPRERCQAFYTEWIEKCANGYVDHVLVAEHRGCVVGYVACRRASPSVGHIELVGVHADVRNRGTGSALVRAALRWFAQDGVERVEVVTQGRNYAAQRLYQRCGFVSKETRLWYHKWFT